MNQACPHCGVFPPEKHSPSCQDAYNPYPGLISSSSCFHRFALGPVFELKMDGISSTYERAFVLCVNCGQVKKVKVIDESN
jgi:hypothetical protein